MQECLSGYQFFLDQLLEGNLTREAFGDLTSGKIITKYGRHDIRTEDLEVIDGPRNVSAVQML
jgi:hypothetical protein